MDISIICTNFNKGPWIAKAIDGFLKQEFQGIFEIIIVDDASTDGSKHIIQEYEKRYPNLIRAYYNEENQGIAKTWASICQKACGKYIARCDGDDYWIDSFKLQKQFDILEKSPESKWCNTDFNIVSLNEELIVESALSSEQIVTIDSYEKMMAYKGFTMSSTWLVEKDLMLEVNELLDLDASDDTFCLQLDLFQKTKLTTLFENTTAYRVGYESDSHPVSVERFIQRHTKLFETQLSYLERYPDFDAQELVKYSFKEIFDREVIIHLNKQKEHQLLEQNKIKDSDIANLREEQAQLEFAIELQEQDYRDLKQKYDALHSDYHKVIGSRRWIIPTKIIDFFRRN